MTVPNEIKIVIPHGFRPYFSKILLFVILVFSIPIVTNAQHLEHANEDNRVRHEIDRTSPSYRDYAIRLRRSVADNSIALLMIADSLRTGKADAQNIVAILHDHRDRVTALESFRAGRHSVTLRGTTGAQLSASGLVQRFTGANASLRGAFDFDIVRHSQSLLPTSGRVAAQTGFDYVVGDAQLIPKACGTLTGGVKVRGTRIADAELDASTTFCYQYRPSSMTALGGYVARNQSRLARLEKLGGEDLAYLTDHLFAHFSSGCDVYGIANPIGCAAIEQHLSDLTDAGLAIDIPTDIRTEAEVRAALLKDPKIAALLEDNDETRDRIDALTDLIGRNLTTVEISFLDLISRFEGIESSFDSAHIELIRQGGILAYMANPSVQENLLRNAMMTAQQSLRSQQREMESLLLESSYSDLRDAPKRAKFRLEIDSVNRQYQQVRGYSDAARDTLLLINALSGSRDSQRDIQRAFSVIDAANELVRSGRTLQNAVHAGMLTSMASVTAYANGVGALLTLVSLFGGSGGPTELDQVLSYLDRRLDVIDQALGILLDHSVAAHHKLDALLAGQSTIVQQVVRNARAIQANRVELRLVRESIEALEDQLQALAATIDNEKESAEEQRIAIFNAEVRIAQEQALRRADTVIGNWLNPDSRIIARLNSGDVSESLLDNLRRERQIVLELIASLTGPEFLLPENILSTEKRLQKRPPVDYMNRLPEYAKAVDFISAYYRDRLQPSVAYYYSDSEVERDVENLHAMAFPRIGSGVFVGLPNPDAFAYVLERYLTFILALTEDARARVGFSDLIDIGEQIERLSESKRTAQSASFVMLSALRRSLPSIASELKDNLGRGRFFNRYNDDLEDFIFAPGDLNFPDDFSEGAATDAFAALASQNPKALDWLLSNARVYLVRGMGSSGDLPLALIERIRRDPTSWRLPPNMADEPWIERLSGGQLEQLNLDTIADVRALFNAYLAGELFTYSAKELAFLDSFTRKAVLEVSDADIAAFLDLIKSDRQLLKLAEEERLITFDLITLDEPVDINDRDPGLASPYAEVVYVVYHRGTQTTAGSTASYRCRGAAIRLLPGAESLDGRPQAYAFPVEVAINRRHIPVALQNAVIDCSKVAYSRGMRISHPRPLGTFDGANYLAVARSPQLSRESFIRDSAMVPDGTQLWHRGRARCALNAEWRSHLAELPEVVHSQSVGRVANFIVYTLDQPFVFESQKEVEKANGMLYAQDGTEILIDEHIWECKRAGQVAQFVIHPGLARLGSPRPAKVSDAGWLSLANQDLKLHSGFRTGIIAALQARRARLAARQLARVGELFREPAASILVALEELDLTGLPRVDQKTLLDAYRSRGADAFFAHPIFQDFRSRYPEWAEHVDRYREFIALEKDHVPLLKAFAEWGLGDCLLTVPEYYVTFGLLWEPMPDTDMSLLKAMELLGDPESVGHYQRAVATGLSARALLEDTRSAVEHFPPRPWSAEARAYLSEPLLSGSVAPYEGIDRQAAIEVATRRGCHPGHGSIVVLEQLHDLMVEASLMQRDAR